MKILVSACLLGINTKYNGSNNLNKEIINLKNRFELIPFCPEVLGGLSTPRLKSEIKMNEVIMEDGTIVTKEFNLGAYSSLNIIKENNISYAILKDGSPSCGKNYIYDGNFNNTKIAGLGITAKLFTNNNIKIYSENEIDKLLEDIDAKF